MPEYLAPGVYVEETDTGSKPIEGVSTSTAGMVGVTERGPTNVPVLITGMGEFVRWFGGQLRADTFADHRFLPHAIEGFFTNGGKRVYLVRVSHDAAAKAESPLFDRGAVTSVSTRVLRPIGEGTGSSVSQPVLVTLPSGLAGDDWIRIGDGGVAEYRQVDGGPVAATVLVAVDLPLSRSHPKGDPVAEFAPAVFPDTFTLVSDVQAGDTEFVLRGTTADVALLLPKECLQLGPAGGEEYRIIVSTRERTVVSGTDSTVRVHLDAPLVMAYASNPVLTVHRMDLTGAPVGTATLQTAPAGGLFFVDNRGGNFDTRTNLVSVGTDPTREVRRIGELSRLTIEGRVGGEYAPGSLVQAVTIGAARSLSAANVATDTTLTLQPDETSGLVVGQPITIDAAGTPEQVTIQSIDPSTDTLVVTPALTDPHAIGATVTPASTTTTAAAAAGQSVLALARRMGIVVGSLLQVGSGLAAQIVTVSGAPPRSPLAPDAGSVVVGPALAADTPSSTPVVQLGTPAPTAGRQATVLAIGAVAGDTELYSTDGDGFVAGDLIRVTTLSNDVLFHTLVANATPLTGANSPEMVSLKGAVARAHPAGSAVVGRKALLDVEALDAGEWGNRLRISVEDEAAGLVARTTLATVINATTIRLGSAAGVQPGTVLEIFDPATNTSLGAPVKVSAINRTANFTITLASAGLAVGQQVIGAVVRSREFSITVRLLRQPDPSTPSRDDQVIDLEVFRYLSLDPRHSNYVATIIGDRNGPLRHWDRRPEGSSLYIRVHDLAKDQGEQEGVRLGPETLIDILPTGQQRAARLRLEQVAGFDAIPMMTDAAYIGMDNADPDLRTGLQCLRNVEQISIVGLPGRVSVSAQQALIDHCELLRYRFAVLDSVPEPNDTISDTQNQRQQFDTKYAALYYPWLSIPDPFPANSSNVRDYAVPPTGHVLGVYARTDIDRGVHKAPANEVLRGITGLRRKLNKEQQDVLNPYPVNINVIRDFRDHNRGIRVYGGRVISSDPDWKYLNVRRLLIFIEASIDRGLQWVVFEPNAEPLWARVRRTIANFLTVVWRNGALEGTKPEEAFFVKCDRTTMTQTEIDNGQLIVVVGVAPVKPAEFVIVRIGLWTAHSDS